MEATPALRIEPAQLLMTVYKEVANGECICI
jgi:hypothetical protein